MTWAWMILVAAAPSWGVGAFNGLMRRHDLVPALVEAVRAYAGHESALFEEVARLRAEAGTTRAPARLAAIEARLEHGVGRLLALKEAYPELEASENFLRLQRDLV